MTRRYYQLSLDYLKLAQCSYGNPKEQSSFDRDSLIFSHLFHRIPERNSCSSGFLFGTNTDLYRPMPIDIPTQWPT